MVNRKRLDPTESAAALFGAKLRKLRDKAGLSQAQLAAEVGYSHDTISKVETAAQAPSPEQGPQPDPSATRCSAQALHGIHPLVLISILKGSGR